MYVCACVHVCACVYACECVCVCVCMWILYLCVHLSYTHIGLSSLVFGQAGLTIDWNWTSQARGVCSSCTCTLFCECVCVCVCVWYMSGVCICAFLCFYNISACYKWGSI